MNNSRQMQALERAIEIAGSQAELARRIAAFSEKTKNVKQAHVWNWLNRDLEVPADMVLAVEASTSDDHGRPRVLRHDLRPDIYPEEAAA